MSVEGRAVTLHREPQMSIDERPTAPPPPAAASAPQGSRLRVITAGVGNLEARLGTSGFDVVPVAATEEALIGAVSADEPDAIVVEATLCESLEHVRDLAPDTVLIVVGDHTPAGALGRIERGVSGTVMAGLLHALVAEGVGGAVAWGLVPAFVPSAGLRVTQHVSGSLLSAAEMVRTNVVNAIHDHAGVVAAASTVVVTASASLLVALNAPGTHGRGGGVADPTPVVERAAQPVATARPATGLPHERPNEAEPGHRHAPRPDASAGHRRHDQAPSERGRSPHGATSDASRPPGVATGWDHRPPKHDDNGHRSGWTDNSVPVDLPPGPGTGRRDRGLLAHDSVVRSAGRHGA
jgi:hypothetical protein